MRILILTASPQRDAIIDQQLKDELTKRGHEAFVRPCLREGRKSVLELTPDIVIVPPVRNPYSRDFVETLQGWGIGVITRHTEASCSWQDYNKMSQEEKSRNVLGPIKYNVDLEVVWGSDEADILTRRGTGFPVVAVGSLAVDACLNKDLVEENTHRAVFNEKLGLDKSKMNLLIGSSWGFADSAPDLRIDEINSYSNEDEGRDKFIALIKDLQQKLQWNIILRPHPGIDISEYKKQLPNVTIETEMTATEMLCNCDALIHSGSTMAIEAHFLGIPAYQFGDVNRKFTTNWFQNPDSPLSRVSPYVNNADEMLAIPFTRETNANPDVLKELEEGRYGLMDGKAIQRTCDAIETIKGKFKMVWPKAHVNHDLPHVFKSMDGIATRMFCHICENEYFTLNQSWMDKALSGLGIKPAELPKYMQCPNCASRLYRN